MVFYHRYKFLLDYLSGIYVIQRMIHALTLYVLFFLILYSLDVKIAH